ncbi:carbonic anhydrase 2 [Moelleriella libera RCEF 2490]|uniref:Carbonic anhydrase n=1 Tax=Moelleriella libera RCEF 2490 TaxID=1081109 RepID=A0A162IVH5_9HYPO|nr:carbonic anhydrase 2 [Moelleriella libera RCEF 2490]
MLFRPATRVRVFSAAGPRRRYMSTRAPSLPATAAIPKARFVASSSPPSTHATTSRCCGIMSHDDSPPSSDEVSKYLRQSHDRLFENNRAWAANKATTDPAYFTKLAAGQAPEYLWIGCSDSRIPAEQITGLEPGEAFIHRNIANLVCNTDLNVMSVINYAVRHLGVKHIIVCGHYGCGGVKAAMTPKDLGLLNPWLRNIRDVYRLHETELDAIADEDARYNRLVELNVVEQCRNIVKTAAIQQSYAKNRYPIVHGWVFGFHDGLLKDLKIDFQEMLRKVQKIYNLADEE